MDFINNVIPVSELKKDLSKIIQQLRKAGSPFLITQNGKSAAFLIGVKDYQEQMKRLKLMEEIIQAEKDLSESRFKTQKEVESLFSSWKQPK